MTMYKSTTPAYCYIEQYVSNQSKEWWIHSDSFPAKSFS